jgi:hypothetical protein
LATLAVWVDVSDPMLIVTGKTLFLLRLSDEHKCKADGSGHKSGQQRPYLRQNTKGVKGYGDGENSDR